MLRKVYRHVTRRRVLYVALAAVIVLSAVVAVLHGGGMGGAGKRVPSASPGPPSPHVSMVASATPLNPTTPITVTTADGLLTTVRLTNTGTGVVVTGAFTEDHRGWRSTQYLGYGGTYRLIAEATNHAGGHAQRQAMITTIRPVRQVYANLIPGPALVAGKGIGVGQPIVFQFTEPVINKAAVVERLRVTSDPQQPGAWYWIDDQDVHYRPEQFWEPGTTLNVSAVVYGLDLGGGVYGAENNSATYRVHDSWIAKADGASEQLQVFDNEQLIKTMPMSLGAPGFPTHEGIHVISDKQPSIIMDSCTYGVCRGQPGYYREKVAWDERISNDGEFVHSAPWSVGQQGNSNVSHGCVNLAPANARWFYDHFGLGDVVETVNSGGRPLPVWDLYGDWALPWSQWQAGIGSAAHS
ncbi:MAG: Ig-like domain-containing protein [Pseudonocardiaceae bacterium]